MTPMEKLIDIILQLHKELPAVIQAAYQEGFYDGATRTHMRSAQTWPNSQTYAQLVTSQSIRLQAIEALELLERVSLNFQDPVETIQ